MAYTLETWKPECVDTRRGARERPSNHGISEGESYLSALAVALRASSSLRRTPQELLDVRDDHLRGRQLSR